MNLTNQLQKIGLSDKEARLYFSLLEAGEAAVQELTIRSGLNRTTVYIILENLLKRGLIRRKYHKEKVVFRVDSPRQILDLLEKEKEDVEVKIKLAKDMLPELEMLENVTGESATVKFYEGKEGLAMLNQDIFRSNPKQVDTIYNINVALKNFPSSKNDHRQKYKKRRMVLRSIAVYDPKLPIPCLPIINNDDERRYLPNDKTFFNAEFSLYNDKAIILSSKGKYLGVLIKNKAIVDGLRFLFNLAWQGAEKYLALKKIKQIKKP